MSRWAFSGGCAAGARRPTQTQAKWKTPRGTVPTAAVRTNKSNYSGVRGKCRGDRVSLLVAVAGVVGRRLQFLLLVGCQQGEDLLVGGRVLFPGFGAPGQLRGGELRNFRSLVVRQLHRFDEQQGLFEAMREAAGLWIATDRLRVGGRGGRCGASRGMIRLGVSCGNGCRGFL